MAAPPGLQVVGSTTSCTVVYHSSTTSLQRSVVNAASAPTQTGPFLRQNVSERLPSSIPVQPRFPPPTTRLVPGRLSIPPAASSSRVIPNMDFPFPSLATCPRCPWLVRIPLHWRWRPSRHVGACAINL